MASHIPVEYGEYYDGRDEYKKNLRQKREYLRIIIVYLKTKNSLSEMLISIYDILSFQYKESENSMTRHEEDKTNYNVEDSAFCFFELLLITTRDQDEPTSIYNENNTDNW